jgi:hypothetical protein
MTDRALPAGMVSAISTGHVKPLFFIECEFAGGTSRLFTGTGRIDWNGHEWTGDGGILRISSMQEVSGIEAVNFSISVNGQLSELVSVALEQVRRGLPGTVWLALIDDAGNMLDAPYKCFKGRADRPNIIPDPVNTVISIGYESRLITAKKTKVRRYTSEDQKLDYPNDLGFDYVPALQDITFKWGTR